MARKIMKPNLTRRTVLGGAGLAVASTALPASAMMETTGNCAGQFHKMQITNLRQTMKSQYIEPSLKRAMLRSASCPNCKTPLGRFAITSLTK